MIFKINFLQSFLNQTEDLDRKSRKIIHDKINLIKENPYRYKRIHSNSYSRVFRIRLKIKSKEKRLIYSVIEPNIVLVCLLDRKKEYKDIEKYLSKIEKELRL